MKGGIGVTGRRRRRRGKLLDDLKERTAYSHLKEEALDRTMWRSRFGRGFGPVVRQTAKLIAVTLAQQHTDTALLCSHCKNGYGNAPQCYVVNSVCICMFN
jgi:hypothetical protein